jgi:hypothetical protein
MAGKRSEPDQLFANRWVHIAEQDTAEGAVYVPDDDRVPLSRKPRDWLELRADGSATLFVPGPDDRPVERQATWQEAGGSQRTRGGSADLEIVDRSASRLVVKKLRT